MDDKQRYEAIGQVWRHFATWRERIFAGYLATLAALGVGFHQYPSPMARSAMLAGGIVVSLVFWILDSRSAHFVNACQTVGRQLEEGKGCYHALTDARFYSTRINYGFAVNVLVAGVIGAAGGGLWLYLPTALQGQLRADVVGLMVALFAAGLWFFDFVGGRRRRTDEKQLGAAAAPPDRSSEQGSQRGGEAPPNNQMQRTSAAQATDARR